MIDSVDRVLRRRRESVGWVEAGRGLGDVDVVDCIPIDGRGSIMYHERYATLSIFLIQRHWSFQINTLHRSHILHGSADWPEG
jgi:hypothetical protein